MTLEQKRANVETLIILEKLNIIDKIPEDIIKDMRSNIDATWNFEYDDNTPLEKQNILRMTAVILSTLYLMYICEDNDEKQKLKKLYEENEQKYNEESLKKLNNF